MSGIELRKITVAWDKEIFFDNLSFTVNNGDVAVLLGLSGSGKSTILKTVLGVQASKTGKVFLNSRDVTNIDIRSRDIGYVPQEQHLFPNMTTEENIGFGLKMRRIAREVRKKRIREVANLVGIDFLQKDPRLLSGGEKQRVALARAIAPNPKTLLMDEPLSSLDTAERLNMSLMLKQVLGELDVTTLYVTHSPQEAEILADSVIVLEGGKIQQIGSFEEVATNPVNIKVAGILGIHNILESDTLSQFDISRYRRGSLYIIPPSKITESDGGIPAKIISHSGQYTFIEVEGKILAMKKCKSKKDIKIEII